MTYAELLKQLQEQFDEDRLMDENVCTDTLLDQLAMSGAPGFDTIYQQLVLRPQAPKFDRRN